MPSITSMTTASTDYPPGGWRSVGTCSLSKQESSTRCLHYISEIYYHLRHHNYLSLPITLPPSKYQLTTAWIWRWRRQLDMRLRQHILLFTSVQLATIAFDQYDIYNATNNKNTLKYDAQNSIAAQRPVPSYLSSLSYQPPPPLSNNQPWDKFHHSRYHNQWFWI